MCVCLFLSAFLHPYVTVCDCLKSIVFCVTSVHMYTALRTCPYIHMRICQERIDYIIRGWIWASTAGEDAENRTAGKKRRPPPRRHLELGELWLPWWDPVSSDLTTNTVWSLRRVIRCNVGDEISADRWSIYSSEKFEKPSQINMEADCNVCSFLTWLPTVKSCRKLELLWNQR